MGKHNIQVELVGYYGSDEAIALAAWTSTSRELTEDKKNRIPQLIKYLYEHSHKTPFERGIVHFLVKSDIATHIHLIKHRFIGANSESARYKELKEDNYYIPDDWNGLEAPENDFSDVFTTWDELLGRYTEIGNELYHLALKDLTPILGRKRAKETARYFKTYNNIITTDCIMNMSCFDNFYKLRHSENAQDEIYNVAEQMAKLIKNIEGNPFETTINLICSTE